MRSTERAPSRAVAIPRRPSVRLVREPQQLAELRVTRGVLVADQRDGARRAAGGGRELRRRGGVRLEASQGGPPTRYKGRNAPHPPAIALAKRVGDARPDPR